MQSHENRGCCGEGNSQHVAAEGEICIADNISACSFYCCCFFFCFFCFCFFGWGEGGWWLFMGIFTLSKQSFNESLDFCNRS